MFLDTAELQRHLDEIHKPAVLPTTQRLARRLGASPP